MKYLAFIPLLAVVASFGLLVSDKRVLIWEHKVEPGQTYLVKDYGNLGNSEQASLVCSYFTGRSINT
jgi:hypothetical protein